MTFTDQMGNAVLLHSHPKRIISLVPSQTELLFDLGLDKQIIGITKFCIHPEKLLSNRNYGASSSTGQSTNPLIIGGTKKLKLDVIRELQPDLIIGNKEENEKNQILELQKEFPVWMSDIKTLDESLNMIEKIGALVSKKEKAIEIKNEIQRRFLSLKELIISNKQKSTVLYLIWRTPYICAGKDTFINNLLETCGFSNLLGQSRYPEISNDEIQKLQPHYIFLSSEPYPFREKHIAELQSFSPASKIVLVDGEMFSWYGTRLLLAPGYFQHLRSQL